MRTNTLKTAQIGELVAAAFDLAAGYTTDSNEVSRLATSAVNRMLRRAPTTSRRWVRAPSSATRVIP